jgi:hypothetical protein
MYIDGKYWSTVEHYFQAMKTLDEEEQEKIRLATHPAISKILGKKVHLREDWDKVKEEIMLKALRVKFENIELRQKLLDTDDDVLEEGNTWNDRYWGKDLNTGFGHNRLGNLLMQVRTEIKEDENNS